MSTATLERPTESSSLTAAAARIEAGHRTLFVVPFRSAMDAPDLERLNRVLDMATHLHPNRGACPTSAGVARLDFFSGLFLARGDEPDTWRLEGRTWGDPAPAAVHAWHLAASDAARLLDRTVPVPAPLARATAAADPSLSRTV